MDRRDVELTKEVGLTGGAHYLAEQQFTFELGLKRYVYTRAQCISLVNRVWNDYKLPADKKHVPVDLFELNFEPGAKLGLACMGKEDTGIHKGKRVFGLRGFKKDKVIAVYLVHELAHAVEIYLKNNETHNDEFSKTFINLVNTYLAKWGDAKTKVWIAAFLVNKRCAENYLRKEMAKAGEVMPGESDLFPKVGAAQENTTFI